MLKITQIKVPIDKSENKRKNDLPDLTNEISRLLHIKKDRIISWKVLKRSIEARKKERLSYVYTVAADVKNEVAVLKSCKSNNITKYVPIRYHFPNENNEEKKELSHRPVIVGSGPAGMICGYLLAKE